MQLICPACLAANRVGAERLGERPLCGKCRAVLLPAEPLALSGAEFSRYTSGTDLPVLVDFWAQWCGPCRTMAPVLDEVARRRADLRIVKVDTDADPAAAARYAIRSIPTLVLLRRGRELGRMSGAVAGTQLLAWVDGVLQRSAAEAS